MFGRARFWAVFTTTFAMVLTGFGAPMAHAAPPPPNAVPSAASAAVPPGYVALSPARLLDTRLTGAKTIDGVSVTVTSGTTKANISQSLVALP